MSLASASCTSLLSFTADSLSFTLYTYSFNGKFSSSSNHHFDLGVKSYNLTIPSLSLPSYPNITLGCNTCTSSSSIPLCDMGYTRQQIPCGVDCEGNITYCTINIPTGFQKCFNEVTFNTINIPSLNLFTLPEFICNFDLNFIIDLNSSQNFTIGNKILGEFSPTIINDTFVESYTINTLKVNQFTMQLKNFNIGIGDFKSSDNTINIKGFHFTLPTISMNPIHYYIYLLNKTLGTNISESIDLLDLVGLTGPNTIKVSSIESIYGEVTLQAEVQLLALPLSNIKVNGQTYNLTLNILFFPFIIFTILNIIAVEEAKQHPNNALIQELKECLTFLNDKTNEVFQEMMEYTELSITYYFLICPNPPPESGVSVINVEIFTEISIKPFMYYKKSCIPSKTYLENMIDTVINSYKIPITKESTYLGLNQIINNINDNIYTHYRDMIYKIISDEIIEGFTELCGEPVDADVTLVVPIRYE